MDNLKAFGGHTVYLIGGNSTDSKWTIRSFNLLSGEWKTLCNLERGGVRTGSGSLNGV